MPAEEPSLLSGKQVRRGFSFLLLLLPCLGSAIARAEAPGQTYVGDQACASCH